MNPTEPKNLVIQVPGIPYPVPLIQFTQQLPQWIIAYPIRVVGVIG